MTTETTAQAVGRGGRRSRQRKREAVRLEWHGFRPPDALRAEQLPPAARAA